MLRVKLTPEDERTFRKAMRELKLDTPSKLRGFLLRRSGTATLALLVDLGIQSLGAASSYALFTMLLHSPNQSWWLKAGAALSAFGAGWFLTSIRSADLVVMTLVIGTSLRLGLSADALLELVEGCVALSGNDAAILSDRRCSRPREHCGNWGSWNGRLEWANKLERF